MNLYSPFYNNNNSCMGKGLSFNPQPLQCKLSHSAWVTSTLIFFFLIKWVIHQKYLHTLVSVESIYIMWGTHNILKTYQLKWSAHFSSPNIACLGRKQRSKLINTIKKKRINAHSFSFILTAYSDVIQLQTPIKS